MSAGDRDKPTSSRLLGSLSMESGETDSKMRRYSERTAEKALPGEVLALIVRVDKENYIPAGVSPTTHVSPYLFTTRLHAQQIEELKADEHVISIEVSEKMRP